MKKKSILMIFGIAALASAGMFALTACDEKNTATSVDDSNKLEITVADDLRDAGVRIDRVLVTKGKTTATVYARFNKLFNVTVILKAFDKTGNEIGRSKRVLTGDVDDATYSDFEFDARVPMKSASYFTLTRASNEVAPSETFAPENVIDPVPAQDVLPEVDDKSASATPPPEKDGDATAQ